MQNFITGTGRCGSTILSRMLMRHPEALVLREFFSTLGADRFSPGTVDGEVLASILSYDRHPVLPFLQRGGTMPEILYRLSEEQKRQSDLRVPGLLLVAFPYLTGSPEALLRRSMEWAASQPERTLGEHYRSIFAYLGERLDRRVCIEASAVNNVDLGIFPEARVLHIHRDGLEVVLSMAAHPFFRLMGGLLREPLTAEEWGQVWARPSTDASDPLFARMRREASAELDPVLANMWVTSVAKNLRLLSRLPRDRVLEMSFEGLLEAPVEGVLEVARFFGLERSRAWAEDAATMLRPVPRRVDRIAPERRAALERLCHVGQILTGRAERARLDTRGAAS